MYSPYACPHNTAQSADPYPTRPPPSSHSSHTTSRDSLLLVSTIDRRRRYCPTGKRPQRGAALLARTPIQIPRVSYTTIIAQCSIVSRTPPGPQPLWRDLLRPNKPQSTHRLPLHSDKPACSKRASADSNYYKTTHTTSSVHTIVYSTHFYPSLTVLIEYTCPLLTLL
jgi:hypothetical protein